MDHYGVFSWVLEMDSYEPFFDYDKDGTATEMERLRWNDTQMGGKIFFDWKEFDHPQLGKVEIGEFVSKSYNSTYRSYINVMCTSHLFVRQES